MKGLMEFLDVFLKSIYLMDLRPDMYEVMPIFFLIGWGILTTGNLFYLLWGGGGRSYFQSNFWAILNFFSLVVINQIYFLILLTIFSLWGPISLIILGIIYIIAHFIIMNDSTDLSLLGISRSIDQHLKRLDDYYHQKSDYKRLHQNSINFYQNFIKSKNN